MSKRGLAISAVPDLYGWTGLVTQGYRVLSRRPYNKTPEKAMEVARHCRQHWQDEPHVCPPTLIIRVDGEIGDELLDQQAPSYTAWQRDVEDAAMKEATR